jgi:hypothetical protein
VPFTFCWHGHCKWEATERRLFLRDRKKTFDQKTFATVQHLPPSSFIVYCYCCSTSSPLRFHLRRKMRSVWRGKRVVAAGIWEVPISFFFWGGAILLGYVICTLNSSRTASFFLFATLSLLNHPVLSLLFLLGIGSMGITRRGKRKPSFHISGLSLCRKDNGRDFLFLNFHFCFILVPAA